MIDNIKDRVDELKLLTCMMITRQQRKEFGEFFRNLSIKEQKIVEEHMKALKECGIKWNNEV